MATIPRNRIKPPAKPKQWVDVETTYAGFKKVERENPTSIKPRELLQKKRAYVLKKFLTREMKYFSNLGIQTPSEADKWVQHQIGNPPSEINVRILQIRLSRVAEELEAFSQHIREISFGLKTVSKKIQKSEMAAEVRHPMRHIIAEMKSRLTLVQEAMERARKK